MQRKSISLALIAILSLSATSTYAAFGLTNGQTSQSKSDILTGSLPGSQIVTIPADENDGQGIPDDIGGANSIDNANKDMRGAFAFSAFGSTVNNLISAEEQSLTKGIGLWADGIAGRSEIGTFQNREYGVRVGMTRRTDHGDVIGVALTATDGSIDGSTFARTDVESFSGTLYGSTSRGSVFAAAAITYGVHNLDAENVDIKAYGASARVGFDIDVAPTTIVSPFAGIRYVGLKEDAASAVSVFQFPVGVSAYKGFNLGNWKIMTSAQAAAVMQTGDDTIEIGGKETLFAGDYAFEGQLAISAHTENFLVGATYRGTFGDEDFTDHRFSVTASYLF